MNRKRLMILLALALALSVWGGLPTQKASATLTSIQFDYFPLYIPIDTSDCTTGGTPFAVRVTVFGTANDPITIQLGNVGPSESACTWNPDTSQWVSISSLPPAHRRAVIGSEGNVEVWLYGRFQGTAGGGTLRARAYLCTDDTYTTCPTTPNVTANVGVTKMDMTPTTGNGGWLEESDGVDRAGRAIAVKNASSQVIGLYVAEPNGVSEGYSGDGYYKIAAPVCPTCGYRIETWALDTPGTSVGVFNTMGLNNCPNTISAGVVTSLNACNAPTAITLISFSATTPAGKATLLALLLLASALVVISIRRRAHMR